MNEDLDVQSVYSIYMYFSFTLSKTVGLFGRCLFGLSANNY